MRRKSREEEERKEAVGSVELKGGIGGERDIFADLFGGRGEKRVKEWRRRVEEVGGSFGAWGEGVGDV